MNCQYNFTSSSAVLKTVSRDGIDAPPDFFRILLNAAMQDERQNRVGSEPHERTERRTGYANG